MKYVRIFSRIIVGCVFVFSGIVKGVDPLGSAYKFNDYFFAFGMEWLQGIALPLGVLLAAAEFSIGIGLLLSLRMKVTSWALLIFMSLFSVVTLYSAVFNPVSDCGCFGDAVKITNWQTFYKNIVLLGLTLIIFTGRKNYPLLYKNNFTEWTIVGVIFAGFFYLSHQSYHHLPLLDFRPYHVGTNIPMQMEIPEGSPMDEYETLLYYEKDGEVKEFTMENYPWQDSTWKWVETKQHLLKEGYKPPIHDFAIFDDSGFEVTEDILNANELTFLLVMPRMNKTNIIGLQKANEIAKWCISQNYKFYAVTASTGDEIKNMQKMNLSFPFYSADEIMLKTTVRANPGLMALKNGTIIGKWNYIDFPSVQNLEKQPFAKIIAENHASKDKLMVTALILGIFLFMAMVKIFRTNWL